ncbi:MAG: septum formation initiator family protein [Clostridia bacterium]|nr:septum formation initiator family protein [Clostridia bacterium]
MRRTVNLWVFVACMVVMIVFFCCINLNIAGSINSLKNDHRQKTMELADLKNKQDELEAEEDTVGTDAFVEQQARDVYDFMMPDELRFVISFPDEQESDPSL